MAEKGRVALSGRFKPGSVVRLVKVAGEHVLRSEGGEEVDKKRVGEDGRVVFASGVEVGARYFIVGRVNGEPLEVRARGNKAGEVSSLEDSGVTPDRTRLSDGTWSDEAPEKLKVPVEAAPDLAQAMVGKGVAQRSQTPRGSAHPVDVKEQPPYPSQSDVAKGTAQMSQTEHGRAAPVVPAPSSQREVPKGVAQRSQTEHGVAAIIPGGGAVKAQLEKESPLAKVARGEPGRAAADPLTGDTKPSARKPKAAPKRKPARKTADVKGAASAPARARSSRSSSNGSRKSNSKKKG